MHLWRRKFFASSLVLLILAGCAHSPPPVTTDIAPAVDHHQHLLSVETADLLSPPPHAVIALPAEIDRLLHERARHWNDSLRLAELFTKDSLVLGTESPGWIRGQHAGAAYLSARFANAYVLTPVNYRPSGSTATVAGYYTRGDGAQLQRFGYFHLVLEKGNDAIWRIAAETSAFPGPSRLLEPMDAAQLVSRLDSANIRRAVVLSDAFLFGSRSLPAAADESIETRRMRVRAENDWVASEVAKYPRRLIAFCSFNPLESYALEELERCTRDGRMHGIKLHFTESRVELRNPQHVSAVQKVFEAANARHLPIVVHVGADGTHAALNAQIFLEQILVRAPDVVVQVAHLWGGELFSEGALDVYAKAVEAGDPRSKNLYFDIAEVALMAERAGAAAKEIRAAIAARIRQIGVQRILFGSDDHIPPEQAWAAFREQIPLTEAEAQTIARNVAPYLR